MNFSQVYKCNESQHNMLSMYTHMMHKTTMVDGKVLQIKFLQKKELNPNVFERSAKQKEVHSVSLTI